MNGKYGHTIKNMKFYHLTYLTGLDAVLHAVELPARVAHLDPGLADVDADTLPHLGFFSMIHGKLIYDMFLAQTARHRLSRIFQTEATGARG